MEQENSKIFEGLNLAQKEAVSNIFGPSLIIAGAGSGKTKVLTCRIANILEHRYDPSSILALTFTNKASKEMKERIALMVGRYKARQLWMGTFHSVFIRFLREEAELLGFPTTFTIYDTSDSRAVIKSAIKELELDDKIYKPNEVHSRISMAKNNLVTSEAYMRNGTLIQNDIVSRKPKICEIYSLYTKKCRLAGAMDFDDILLFTNILFRDFPAALDRIRRRFKFIMVDEYQDTNYAQYLIIKKLSEEHKNISVVGDDAQSIYSFRGARIENILNFKKDYPQTKEFRLEQNYRSTQTIVNAANSLIGKNKIQLKKRCFSQQEEGEKIELISAFTEQEEGFLVASSIMEKINLTKDPFSNFAILYRTNAQSRVIEEALRRKNIPYKIFAGHSFYDRAEVKDFLAYLRLITNEKDDEAFKRVVNFPARGIGDTSMSKLRDAANTKELSLSQVVKCDSLEEFGLKGAIMLKLKNFVSGLEIIREKLWRASAYDIACEIDSKFGIRASFKQDNNVESLARLENVDELFNSIKEFVEEGEKEYQEMMPEETDLPIITLDLYLENVSLLSDLDVKENKEDNNKISLMTVHSSKGLEFPYVYILGMEENLFPSSGFGSMSEQDLEEERRLFYVAVTRAGKGVKLSFAHSRMKWGTHVNNQPSRFIRELGAEFIANPIEEIFEVKDIPVRNNSSRYNFNNSPRLTPKPEFSKTTHTANPNFIADAPHLLKEGQKVEHERFGFGTILNIEGDATSKKAIVQFEDGTQKTLLLKFAKIKIVK